MSLIDNIKARTPAQAIDLRTSVIEAIWGCPKISTENVKIEPLPLNQFDFTAICVHAPSTQHKFTWTWATHRGPLRSVGYYVRFPGSTKLAIFHLGHGGFYVWGTGIYYGINSGVYQAGALIPKLVAAGCDMVFLSMPIWSDNHQFRAAVSMDVQNAHDVLGETRDMFPTYGTPLRYYLEPIHSSIGLARSLNGAYAMNVLAGWSGGGWSIAVAGALDPRIDRVYSIAGTMPMQYAMQYGLDYEQRLPGIYPDLDYTDLWLMNVAEPGRRLVLGYNDSDACCFLGELARTFDQGILDFADDNGFEGLRFAYSPLHGQHDIQADMQDLIMADLAT